MAEDRSEEIARRFRELVEIVARLRAPGGCPWDREQTHDSIKGLAIEEAYEVAEAIDLRDDAELRAELGDLLLQVVFHSQMSTALLVSVMAKFIVLPAAGSFPVIAQPVQTYCVVPRVSDRLT